MSEKRIPQKCKRCALLGNCEYLRPESCQHFRAIPSNSPPSVLVRVSDDRARPIPSASDKLIVPSELGSGIGYGLVVTLALIAVFWACGGVLPIFRARPIYPAVYCFGAFVAGILSSRRVTSRQRWRHAAILSGLNLFWLFGGFAVWNVLFVAWGIACIVAGSILSPFFEKIRMIP